MIIREEQPQDFGEIEKVIIDAFLHEEISDQTEHALVGRVRMIDAYLPSLTLVATEGDAIVGHIMLSSIHIVKTDGTTIPTLALAPVSVLSDRQRNGIGTLLIQTALTKAAEQGHRSIIVLGHPDYYTRFGFKPASLWEINSPFDAPDNAFMALELTPAALQNAAGTVAYSEPFM